MRRLIQLLLLAASAVGPQLASASELGKPVTKTTQKELGLEFDLAATREPEAVIVKMTIPKSGPLKDLLHVRLSILAPDGKNYLLRVPMHMVERRGSVEVSAQIAPELAEKSRLDLVTREGRRGFFYAVMLADYVTDGASK